MPEPQSPEAARTAALLHIPRAVLPQFMKALEARTQPATTARSFIPDNSLRCTPTPDGFTLKLHSNQESNVTGVARFEQDGERLWIRWSLEFKLWYRLMPILAWLGAPVVLFVAALSAKAPLQLMLVGLAVGTVIHIAQKEIERELRHITNARMLHCIVECILEAERSNPEPLQSPAVPAAPTP